MFTKPTSASAESTARPYIQLFNRRSVSAWDGERYVGPKILAYHRSTFNNQACKARRTARHGTCTRYTPDGKTVLYTSDLTAYSNMYLAEVGEFDELSDLE